MRSRTPCASTSTNASRLRHQPERRPPWPPYNLPLPDLDRFRHVAPNEEVAAADSRARLADTTEDEISTFEPTPPCSPSRQPLRGGTTCCSATAPSSTSTAYHRRGRLLALLGSG